MFNIREKIVNYLSKIVSDIDKLSNLIDNNIPPIEQAYTLACKIACRTERALHIIFILLNNLLINMKEKTMEIIEGLADTLECVICRINKALYMAQIGWSLDDEELVREGLKRLRELKPLKEKLQSYCDRLKTIRINVTSLAQYRQRGEAGLFA